MGAACCNTNKPQQANEMILCQVHDESDIYLKLTDQIAETNKTNRHLEDSIGDEKQSVLSIMPSMNIEQQITFIPYPQSLEFIKQTMDYEDKQRLPSLQLANGSIYQGDWHQGKRNGYGILTSENGEKYFFYLKPFYSRYEGEWVDESMNGQGTFLMINGDKYSGQWARGQANGFGTLLKTSGYVYEGQWLDNQQSGSGTEKWPDRTIHRGMYREGEKNGKGVMELATGDVYTGEFEAGKICGRGTFRWADGREYSGEWFDNCMNGKGCMTWPDGRKYVGMYANDQKDGHGTFQWRDGRIYVGQWKNGKQDGYGIFTNQEGEEDAQLIYFIFLKESLEQVYGYKVFEQNGQTRLNMMRYAKHMKNQEDQGQQDDQQLDEVQDVKVDIQQQEQEKQQEQESIKEQVDQIQSNQVDTQKIDREDKQSQQQIENQENKEVESQQYQQEEEIQDEQTKVLEEQQDYVQREDNIIKYNDELLDLIRNEVEQEEQSMNETIIQHEDEKQSNQNDIQLSNNSIIQHTDNKSSQIKTKATNMQSIGEKAKLNIAEIFQFYCKQTYVQGKYATFERLQFESTIMTLGKYMYFNRDFGLIDFEHQSNEQIKKLLETVVITEQRSLQQSSPAKLKAKTLKYRKPTTLTKEVLCEVFKKSSQNSRDLNQNEFLQSLKRIAEVIFLKKLVNRFGYSKKKDLNEFELGRLKEQAFDLFIHLFEIHDINKMRKKCKLVRKPFNMKDNSERVQLDQLKYQFKLYHPTLSDQQQLKHELERRKQEKEKQKLLDKEKRDYYKLQQLLKFHRASELIEIYPNQKALIEKIVKQKEKDRSTLNQQLSSKVSQSQSTQQGYRDMQFIHNSNKSRLGLNNPVQEKKFVEPIITWEGLEKLSIKDLREDFKNKELIQQLVESIDTEDDIFLAEYQTNIVKDKQSSTSVDQKSQQIANYGVINEDRKQRSISNYQQGISRGGQGTYAMSDQHLYNIVDQGNSYHLNNVQRYNKSISQSTAERAKEVEQEQLRKQQNMLKQILNQQSQRTDRLIRNF